MKRAPGWWWRFPAMCALLVAIAVAMTLAGAAVGATWNTVIGALR